MDYRLERKKKKEKEAIPQHSETQSSVRQLLVIVEHKRGKKETINWTFMRYP